MSAKIGVIETGRPSEDLITLHGDYVQMVCDWLGFDRGDCLPIAACDNAPMPASQEADFWVITGSKAGVYEDHAWIAPLSKFIRACKRDGVPMVGICFGHQMIAQALGGIVRKSPKGWGLGVHTYMPQEKEAQFQPLQSPFCLQAVHQDQIETPPKDAICLASSDFCTYAALYYPGFAITFQGHPEMNAPFVHDLLISRRKIAMPPDRVDPALNTVRRPTDAKEISLAVRTWLETFQSR